MRDYEPTVLGRNNKCFTYEGVLGEDCALTWCWQRSSAGRSKNCCASARNFCSAVFISNGTTSPGGSGSAMEKEMESGQYVQHQTWAPLPSHKEHSGVTFSDKISGARSNQG